jgi:hypothetical protein
MLDGRIRSLGILADLRATEDLTPPKPLNNGEFLDITTGELHSPNNDKSYSPQALRRDRINLMRYAQSIAPPYHRLTTCLTRPIDGDITIARTTDGQASLRGLITCGNPWACPVCSSKINNVRAAEVTQLVQSAKKRAYHVSMLTLTVPHYDTDLLQTLINRLSKSLASFFRQRAVRSWLDNNGYVGRVRSFEIRYGINGWHPHVHILLITKHKINSADSMLEQWKTCAKRHGFRSPNHHGLTLTTADVPGHYITKFSPDGDLITTKTGKPVTWDAVDELTRGHRKKSKSKQESRSPFQILIDAKNGCDNSKNLFLEFLDVIKKTRLTQIKTSPGLKALLGVDITTDDDEAMRLSDENATPLLKMTYSAYKKIINVIPDVLDAADVLSPSLLRAFLIDRYHLPPGQIQTIT